MSTLIANRLTDLYFLVLYFIFYNYFEFNQRLNLRVQIKLKFPDNFCSMETSISVVCLNKMFSDTFVN